MLVPKQYTNFIVNANVKAAVIDDYVLETVHNHTNGQKLQPLLKQCMTITRNRNLA